MTNPMRDDVLSLTRDGTRRVGTAGHLRAREFIVERLASLGLPSYSGKSHVIGYGSGASDFANLVAVIQGSEPGLAPILLGAHYDTCGDVPGADDNSAGVAILLDTAEELKLTGTKRSVIIAFFDGEEPPNFLQPTMGSIRFYEDQLTGPLHAAVILDLVGHDVPVPGMEDLIFITGAESDPQLADIVLASEPKRGLRTVPTLNSYVGDLSDHHIFRTGGCPYLFLTCGHSEHYHQPTDTVEGLNFEKMIEVSRYLQTLVRRLSEASLAGPFGEGDTLGVEINHLRKNILPTLAAMGISPPLESRSDVDRLVYELMTRFEL